MPNNGLLPQSLVMTYGRHKRRKCFAMPSYLKPLNQCAEVTDEAGAIEVMGLKPKLVRSDTTNLQLIRLTCLWQP